MTNSELNQFILHYLTEDKSQRAIMLTGDWGIGKSYYIQKELIPFLKEDKNGKHSCIVVSLYGIDSIAAISINIIIESRIIPIKEKSNKHYSDNVVFKKFKELFSKADKMIPKMFVAKTFINSLANKYNIDLTASDKDLQSMVNFADLKNNLIILEDLERSSMDIMDILGYVNSLVEQDGVKVLLVSNESEILHYDYSEPAKDGQIIKTPDAKTALYLKSKEKTVGDTIVFQGDLHNAVKTIMLSFDNSLLSSMASDETINDIVDLMYLKSTNLRTLIYALQKISDIFNMIDEHDENLLKTILFSVINFAVQIKGGSFPKWEGTDLASAELGYSKYPLYRFCYDYLRWQEFDKTKVSKAVEAYSRLKKYNTNDDTNGDNDLNVLFNYYTCTEEVVRTALNNIAMRLNDSKSFSYYIYVKLAYHFVICRHLLDFDYSSCKEKMIINLRNREENVDSDLMLFNHYEFDSEEEKKEFDDFIKAIKEVIEKPVNIFEFTYSPEDIYNFYRYVAKHNDAVTSGHAFISKFDFDSLLSMIFACNPSQLQDVRGIFLAVYRHAMKGDFVEDDVVFMQDLLSKIKEHLSDMSDNDDRIIKLQLSYLIGNLKHFIKQLS